MANSPRTVIKGRGALDNPTSRYSQYQSAAFDDGWDVDESQESNLRTTLYKDTCRKG